MKKPLLIIFLVSLSTWAQAGWTYVDVTMQPNGKVTMYEDVNARILSNDGRFAASWLLYDLEKKEPVPGYKPMYSTLLKMAFDCEKGRNAIMSFAGFTKKMGGGQLILKRDVDFNDLEWENTPPTSVTSTVMLQVCSAMKAKNSTGVK